MRVKVRAVILEGRRLLVVREQRQGRPHVSLPGGRVNRWESVTDALVREIGEETGLAVEPGPLLYIAETTAPHRVEDLNLIFAATPNEWRGLDRLEFVDLDRLEGVRILPPILHEISRDAASGWSGNPRWLDNIWDPSA
jgi:ADP-ribose pyrophosphatase YjhB (NUDIX family)